MNAGEYAQDFCLSKKTHFAKVSCMLGKYLSQCLRKRWSTFWSQSIDNQYSHGRHACAKFIQKYKSPAHTADGECGTPAAANKRSALSSTLACRIRSQFGGSHEFQKKCLLVGRFGISTERVVVEKVERKICSARFLYIHNCCGMTTKLPVCWCGWRRRCLSFTAIFTSHDLVRNAEPGWLVADLVRRAPPQKEREGII